MAEEIPVEKKKKIQVKPGVINADTNYLTSLPILPEEGREYKPIFYTFRTAKPDCGEMHVQNLPFYVQLDQCIAVIWALFNANSGTPGITQLQWALTFLKGISNKQGGRPVDIQKCINRIEDILLDNYKVLARIGDTPEFFTNSFGKITKDFYGRKANSITYQDMIRNGRGKGKKCMTCMDKIVVTDEELLEEIKELKKAAGIDSVGLLEDLSKDKTLAVLAKWKQKQLEKLQSEFEVLRCIEDTLKSTDEDTFGGYVTQEELEALLKLSNR